MLMLLQKWLHASLLVHCEASSCCSEGAACQKHMQQGMPNILGEKQPTRSLQLLREL
jgi:hypothetical protein